ncbi:flagellar hook-associated protein 3 FlgL [Roseovarius azorensis]|uniref:Flagellar hook-associated protein 3 FlgL n=1 Tax=Roseovarius azorensis TaxID=1287727 RepID=A0A1H7R4Q1_9RHOB|nr:flagellin [Roseovarius azorensis]SEL55102.1 flagellar hook-associated protein 3 FlgL [Roseovarius azorensis]
MNLQTFGDMAQTFALRRQGTTLKQQMDLLTRELSSGRAADLSRHLAGNLLRFSQIEHDFVILSSHRTAAREAAVDTRTMQTALGQVQTLSVSLAGNAITVGSAAGGVRVDTLAAEARSILGSMIGALNSSVAGRTLFSGTQTDRVPLAPLGTLLDDLRLAVQGADSPDAVRAALDVFFDTPGGDFETTIYRGGTTDLSPYELGAGESVALTIRGDDPVLRGQMKQVALAALSDDPGVLLSEADRRNLVFGAGTALLAQQPGMTALRANLGFAEARIEQSASRISAEITSLQTARNDLVSADAFETAGNLQQVQFQLETLYTLTARAARLSLVNFLS